MPFDQTEFVFTAPSRSSNTKQSVRSDFTIRESRPANESPASATASEAGEIISQKAINTAMLNHIAEHLQFLALLTPRLLTEKLTEGKTEDTSSSRALSSDGSSGRRSTLDEEFQTLGLNSFNIIQENTPSEPGADNEGKREDDQTRALLWAAENGHETVVMDLISAGANTETSDPCGRKPISLAAMNGHELLVECLVASGAIFDAKDEDGQTALSWAAMNGHTAVVRLLILLGADINARDLSGMTPLSWAAMNGHEPVVESLYNYGADVDAKDRSGRTPLSLAEMDGHETVVECLRQHVAKIEAEGRSRQSEPGEEPRPGPKSTHGSQSTHGTLVVKAPRGGLKRGTSQF